MTTYDAYLPRLLPRRLARPLGRWARARSLGAHPVVAVLCGGETSLGSAGRLAWVLSWVPGVAVGVWPAGLGACHELRRGRPS